MKLLLYIRTGGVTSDGVVEWLMDEIDVGKGRARHLKGHFRAMDLYTIKHDVCEPTEAGIELAEKRSARPVVRGLINAMEYLDKILPKLVQDGVGTEDDLVAFLAEEHGKDVKRYKIRCRLKWLAGLGLGTFGKRKLTLTRSGEGAEGSATASAPAFHQLPLLRY